MTDKIDTSTAAIEALMDGVTPGNVRACNMVHADRGGQMTAEEIGEYVAGCVRIGDQTRFMFLTGKNDDGDDIDVCHIGNGPRGPANARFLAACFKLVPALAAERDAAVLRAKQAERREASLMSANEEARQFLRQRNALKAEIEAMRPEAEVRNEGFALGWKAAIWKAEEVCESIRIGIANGPMPEGARFDYEQSVRALTPPTDAAAALVSITAQTDIKGETK